MALTNKLTAIADAIRSKTGKTGTMTLDQMPTEIESISSGSGGWAIPEEAFVLKGETNQLFSGGSWDWFLELCGSELNFDGSLDLYRTFSGIKLSEIPIKPFEVGRGVTNCQYTFAQSKNLIKAPKITGIVTQTSERMFYECSSMIDASDVEFVATKNGYTTEIQSAQEMFSYCTCLEKLPDLTALSNTNLNWYSYSFTYRGFRSCSSLPEAVNVPPGIYYSATSNMYDSFLYNCYRLSRLSFADTGKTCDCKNQTLDMSGVGYAPSTSTSLPWSSSSIVPCPYTSDTLVNNDDTYARLKNDEHWWTNKVEFSRYNKVSAVETINSLPDYSTGRSNTIKFKGAAGSSTDGGAINTMTAEEIAVATAKGWTVTFV